MAATFVEARIDINFYEEPWPEHGDIIALPQLRCLYISDWHILDFLTTPALQEMAFSLDEAEASDLLDNLDPFLVRSACNLRRICFRGSPNDYPVIEVLQKYPFVTELVVITNDTGAGLNAVCKAASTLISHLTIPNIDPTWSAPVSPHLSVIDFGCSGPGPNPVTLLESFPFARTG
ncbi:hypothetical protein B0H17DRAFT_1133431 [Mycena rosella]|uniref:Uncharacterized protein n=1 Tax=Mycena rosella TaxID=1033263 RepID=A0AAD7DJU2_MYCRO|nr:hypothetical protein B0H17DRAFT_1133431 [Mycena rosella]